MLFLFFFADNILQYFYFSWKTSDDISCKLSPLENKKKMTNLLSAEFALRVVKVNVDFKGVFV